MTFGGYPDTGEGVSDIIVVGAPCDLGVTGTGGQRFGPDSIRAASGDYFADPNAYEPWSNIDMTKLSVTDAGDIPIVIGDYTASLAEIEWWVTKLAKQSNRLVVMGGDDGVNTAALGGLYAKEGRQIVVVHLDAHADYYTPTSENRRDHGTWVRNAYDDGYVEHVYQFGIRALMPDTDAMDPEFEKHVTSRHIDDVRNLGKAVANAIARHPGSHFHLAIDIDAVDPAHAPGTGFPEPGGFTAREVLTMVRKQGHQFQSLAVTEVLPAYDQLGLTAQLAARIIQSYVAVASVR